MGVLFMVTKSFFQTMKDGTEISVNRWVPDSEPKAIIVISHGMAEHSMRYDKTASLFVEDGFLVSAHDHRGHGKTALKQKEKGQVGLGYLSDKKGFEKVRDDILEIINQLKTEFPDKKIILLGHSFGSMIGQAFIEKYSEQIDLCILSGTTGPQKKISVRLGHFLTTILYLFGQKKHTSNLLTKMTFGNYNNKIKDKHTEFDWITKDDSIVDMYISDAWCGFTMTTEFYRELFRLLIYIHKGKNIKSIYTKLPIFLIAGKDDPVGNYGKSVETLYKIYKKNGINDVEIKLYENDRHELFNETDSNLIVNDVSQWINKRL